MTKARDVLGSASASLGLLFLSLSSLTLLKSVLPSFEKQKKYVFGRL